MSTSGQHQESDIEVEYYENCWLDPLHPLGGGSSNYIVMDPEQHPAAGGGSIQSSGNEETLQSARTENEQYIGASLLQAIHEDRSDFPRTHASLHHDGCFADYDHRTDDRYSTGGGPAEHLVHEERTTTFVEQEEGAQTPGVVSEDPKGLILPHGPENDPGNNSGNGPVRRRKRTRYISHLSCGAC